MLALQLLACAEPVPVRDASGAWAASHADCAVSLRAHTDNWTADVFAEVAGGLVAPPPDCAADLDADFGIEGVPEAESAAWALHLFPFPGAEAAYDRAAGRITSVTAGPVDGDGGAAVEVDIDTGAVTVEDPSQLLGLLGSSVLVHEARHRDAGAPRHVDCGWGDGACDPGPGGAYGAQAGFLRQAQAAAQASPYGAEAVAADLGLEAEGCEARVLR